LQENVLDIKIKTLKLEEFQRLPESMRATQQMDGAKDLMPNAPSFLSRIESAAYFNQLRDRGGPPPRS
jgi:hypothetical protein|tara:strand:+ start:75 stop:278 length:204 start_codon:yes stop_codon:yes gene_type:complete